MSPADDGGKTSSLAVVWAKGWIGALSGRGRGVGEGVPSSSSLAGGERDGGTFICRFDLFKPFVEDVGRDGLSDRVGKPAAAAEPV